jgi:hypothetical protein
MLVSQHNLTGFRKIQMFLSGNATKSSVVIEIEELRSLSISFLSYKYFFIWKLFQIMNFLI